MMRLTEQQKKILEHVAANPGLTAKEIAKDIGTSHGVVKQQMMRINDSLAGTGSKVFAKGYVLRGE